MGDVKIDAHAHVWDRTCHILDGASYRPDYEAPVDDYLRLLDAHGIEQAVLVQPSFLGTDNRYLLRALGDHGDRFRGIVVVDPGCERGEMEEMAGRGVIGLRLNLLHQPVATIEEAPWQDLIARADAVGWWIEVHAEGADWLTVLPAVEHSRLMIDHMGRPGGPDCPGFAAILGRTPTRTCVKLSAPYRMAADPADAARDLVRHFGAERCLWGSDWPWTQHESAHVFRDCLAWLRDWTDKDTRAAMRHGAPGLTGFADL